MTSRENTIHNILTRIPKEALLVACNGKIGRELFEVRVRRGEPNDDFIMNGSMGCAFAIALGVALNTKKEVYCLLGDGNFLMKMGTVATYLSHIPLNLHIIILNNNSHDSTGGQFTDFSAIREYIPPQIVIVDVLPNVTRLDLGRPTISPIQIKKNFMAKVNEITPDNPLPVDEEIMWIYKRPIRK